MKNLKHLLPLGLVSVVLAGCGAAGSVDPNAATKSYEEQTKKAERLSKEKGEDPSTFDRG